MILETSKKACENNTDVIEYKKYSMEMSKKLLNFHCVTGSILQKGRLRPGEQPIGIFAEMGAGVPHPFRKKGKKRL